MTLLIKKVRSKPVLRRAWKIIERNANASKSPKTQDEVAAFAAHSDKNIDQLVRLLRSEKFEFGAAEGKAIPKKSGGFRPLVVARIEARLVQRAIHDVLVSIPTMSRYTENKFSFGGIRKRNNEELSAVPAAIQAVLNAIESGARYIISADIESFFTRISKSAVTKLIARHTDDVDFLNLFQKAIHVELSNMSSLREKAKKFPIEDIGVAQGNSLSPLLGNIILHDFDVRMNEGDCVCLRYIDDIIILAPSKKAAQARFRLARQLLGELGMSVNPDKSQYASTTESFCFLGIEFANGLLRPDAKARARLLESVQATLSDGRKALKAAKSGAEFDRNRCLIGTLRRLDGLIRGWGKHYRFCNDGFCLRELDKRVSGAIGEFIAAYSSLRSNADTKVQRRLLGVELLADIERAPFNWPPTM